MKRILFILIALAAVSIGAIAAMEWNNDRISKSHSAPAVDTNVQIARGEYLARAGNCKACHTSRGGAAYAGGRAIQTPFGSIPSTNITPDTTQGIGNWTPDDFWRALHNGRSKDGRFLYPAFPYPNYTKVSRSDSDALFAYLQTIPPSNQANQENSLRFPFNQRLLLAGWRALYFRPEVYQPEPTQSAEWNRGAYLVQGLGHCSACHTNRNVLGATESGSELAGSVIPVLNWYAPSLTSDAEAGLGNWETRHIVQLLRTGVSPRGAVLGPMSEVVKESLQYLSEEDIQAMAVFLKSLPQADAPRGPTPVKVPVTEVEAMLKSGAALYEKHCAECHRADGRGIPSAFPPLAGNQTVNTASAINSIRVVLNGGFAPSTEGNPRPFGMPPFGFMLNDDEVAAVVTYIRNSWGNQASPVSSIEVGRYRGVVIE